METTLKGWVWEISFYPITNNFRPLKSIFWYDSSDEMLFTQFQEGYEILVPETLIQSNVVDKEFIRNNKEHYITSKKPIVTTDNNGIWRLLSTARFL
jgi:hypothetical protein